MRYLVGPTLHEMGFEVLCPTRIFGKGAPTYTLHPNSARRVK